MGQRQAGPATRELRIQFRCTTEQIDGHPIAVLSVASHVEPTHQIELIGFYVLRGATTDIGALLRRQFDLERSNNGLRDLVLQSEDITEVPVITLRPQVMADPSVDQLRGDSDAVARLAYTAFHDMRHAEVSCH